MESTLKNFFGFSKFRQYQKEIVEEILGGRDCLVVMATGSGKSLCYQVPPLISKKTAVVISPLISLMQDQVMSLKERGIQAEYISSAQTNPNVLSNAEKGQYAILYLTPEKACTLTDSFWSRLLISGICLLAVDEAHCISEWGHSFRVEYKQLDKLHDVLLDVPVVGLTATATEKVRGDIIHSLKMHDPHVTIGSFDRPNLFYSVKSIDRSNTFLDDLIKEISTFADKANSTIIYCTTVKDAVQIFESLEEAGIASGLYHGQMSSKARQDSHRSFIRDEFYVMVATIAFGMGIDKPDIRCVIHYGCPKSLESYYQESGRCGRDGISSTCKLYYTRSDFAKADFYCAEAHTADQRKAIMESYVAAQRYCMLNTCRRKYLLEYFGEKISSNNCGTCDNCIDAKKERDMSREAFLLMACVQSCGGRWGLNLPVDVLRGSRSKKILDAQLDKLPFHGIGKEFSSNWWKEIAYQLISRGYLIEIFRDIYKTVSVGPKGMQFLNSCNPDYQPPLYLTLTPEIMGDGENKDAIGPDGVTNDCAQVDSNGLCEEEDKLYKTLVEERMKYARDAGTAPYALCGDQTLRRIALARPSTRARLANIEGVNQHLLTVHGHHLLETVCRLSKELKLTLDGEPHAEPVAPRKAAVLPKNKKLTPARFQSWQMWQDGLTLQKIANFPGRGAPIKEQTVLEHLFEASREGYEIDWTRLCGEIELTRESLKCIQEAISKVGTEKLKPIKEELPEEVSYGQIKAVLIMQEKGVNMEVIPSGNHGSEVDESSYSKAFDISSLSCQTEGSKLNLKRSTRNEDGQPTVDTINDDCSVDKCQNLVPDIMLENADIIELTAGANDLNGSKKRQKLSAPPLNELIFSNEATDSSVLSWLQNFENGVSLSDIMRHFDGSSEDTIIDILRRLEGDFSIFKKNNVYKIM